jgi:hypothetical protein
LKRVEREEFFQQQSTFHEAKCFFEVTYHSTLRTLPWASMGMVLLYKIDAD